MQAAAFGRRLHFAALIFSALALVALLCARLLALLPNAWFTPLTLCAVPALALVTAAILMRRPAPAHVARALDERARSKELFLTATMIDQAPGEYRGIVLSQSEERAAQLDTVRLFPLRWLPGARNIALALTVLTAGALWLPTLDPFRMGEKRQAQTKQDARLAETKKITAIRREELKEKGGALAEQVDQALAKLDKTLKEMKPKERELNAKKLNEEAQDFSELWKKVAAQMPKDTLEKAAQQFGESQQRQAMKELLEKLKKGDSESLRQAMDKLRQQMQEIAKKPEGSEKKDQLEKLGIDGNDFEEALYAALEVRGDDLEASESEHVASALEEMSITVGGKTYRLGDLASVSIEEFDEDDEDPE